MTDEGYLVCNDCDFVVGMAATEGIDPRCPNCGSGNVFPDDDDE